MDDTPAQAELASVAFKAVTGDGDEISRTISGIRFAALVSFLDLGMHMSVRLSIMALVIALTNVPPSVAERMYLREELCCAGLVEALDDSIKEAEEILLKKLKDKVGDERYSTMKLVRISDNASGEFKE